MDPHAVGVGKKTGAVVNPAVGAAVDLRVVADCTGGAVDIVTTGAIVLLVLSEGVGATVGKTTGTPPDRKSQPHGMEVPEQIQSPAIHALELPPFAWHNASPCAPGH